MKNDLFKFSVNCIFERGKEKMCKLIKFKKEIFDNDIRNRRNEVRRETTIEREYTTLRFNFSDFTKEEKKELLVSINEFLDKFVRKKERLSQETKAEIEDKIYFNLLSMFTVKHILNQILPNLCSLAEDKVSLIFKNKGIEKTIKVHSLFIRNEVLFGLYADRKFFRKNTPKDMKDESVFNILGDEVNSKKEADIHFMIFYDAIILDNGDFKTFKSLYINENINSKESRKEFYIIGFSYKDDIKEYQQQKEIVNNVFHRKGQKDKEEGKIYNVAPIFKIKDFSKFLEIFCKEYKVDNPYKSYKIEDFEIKVKNKKEKKIQNKKQNRYDHIEDEYYEGYYPYGDPLDIEFTKNYDLSDNPYDMSAEEYYWYLEDYDPY